jgi:hypothetical protein
MLIALNTLISLTEMVPGEAIVMGRDSTAAHVK